MTKMARQYKYIISADIALTQDWTVITVLKRVGADYNLIHMDRFKHTEYDVLIAKLIYLEQHPNLADGSKLVVVDRGGVGASLPGLLKNQGLQVYGCFIHGGKETKRNEYEVNASKKDLVLYLQNVLQKRRLKIPASMPLRRIITQEFQNFTPKVSMKTEHVSYEGTGSTHDDTVLSIAMAVLMGECIFPDTQVRYDIPTFKVQGSEASVIKKPEQVIEIYEMV